MDNTILTIIGTALTVFGSAVVSWIGIYIKVKLDRATDRGYYVNRYNRNIYLTFTIAFLLPIVVFLAIFRGYNDFPNLQVVQWCHRYSLLFMFIVFIGFSLLNKAKANKNFENKLAIFHILFLYYFLMQGIGLSWLYFELYEVKYMYFSIILLCSLSVIISLLIQGFCYTRFKNMFFKDTYEKIRENYHENKTNGYFYVNDILLTDHMMFCLTNGFYCSRLPLHELVKITGEEKRVIFFSDSTIDYFKSEDKKAEIKCSKEAKKSEKVK